MTYRPELPMRPFLYTLDQIATITAVSLPKLKNEYVYYVGLDAGPRKKDLLVANNIAPAGSHPDWRIEERELIRWMKRNGLLSAVRFPGD